MQILRLIIPLALLFSLTGAGNDMSLRFYAVIAGNSVEQIDNLLDEIEISGDAWKDANIYKGALYARKAGLVKTPAERLELFKKGRLLIEQEISRDPNNAEYRFIRLIIQEHAPKAVRYQNNITEDAELVISKFDLLSNELKTEVIKYSRTSQFLSIPE
jgi:hypothetical protein